MFYLTLFAGFIIGMVMWGAVRKYLARSNQQP